MFHIFFQYVKKSFSHTIMLIISIIALLILVCSTINIYIYYRDVKEIQELTKEKLRLEIQLLKNK